MPPLDDNIADLEPSADLTLDDQGAAVSTAKPDQAASSPATGENDDLDLLNVVRDVVKDRAPTASPAEGEEDKGLDAGTPKKDDDENYSDVPFNKHPRFQQLLRKSKAFETDAIRYQNVQTFLDKEGLSANEAADALVIAGLMKTNPAQAWAELQPTLQKLAVAAGVILSDDLQQRVQRNELSHAAALEISRATARASSVEAAQSFQEQRRQQQERTSYAQSITSAAQEWEQDRQLKDPNFAAKQDLLMKEVAYLQVKEGKPTTPDGVRAQLQKAYKATNASFRPPVPAAPAPQARPAIRPVMGGQVAGNQRPAAMSTLDIVRANRRA
jgi:cell division protein ZapA (FtsZ GTPase activity inhibitor)